MLRRSAEQAATALGTSLRATATSALAGGALGFAPAGAQRFGLTMLGPVFQTSLGASGCHESSFLAAESTCKSAQVKGKQ